MNTKNTWPINNNRNICVRVLTLTALCPLATATSIEDFFSMGAWQIVAYFLLLKVIIAASSLYVLVSIILSDEVD